MVGKVRKLKASSATAENFVPSVAQAAKLTGSLVVFVSTRQKAVTTYNNTRKCTRHK